MESTERHEEPLLTYSIASMEIFVQLEYRRTLTGVYTEGRSVCVLTCELVNSPCNSSYFGGLSCSIIQEKTPVTSTKLFYYGNVQ